MKKRLLCAQLPAVGQRTRLSQPETHHACKVLRLAMGSEVIAIDGRGGSQLAILCAGGPLSGGEVWLEGVEDPAAACDGAKKASSGAATLRAGVRVVLQAAILKKPAMDWLVEKACELGAHQLLPLVCDHSVVRLDRKGPELFQARWQKIADQALKQCGRLEQLRVELPGAWQLPASRATIFWLDEKAADGGGGGGGDDEIADGPPLHLLAALQQVAAAAAADGAELKDHLPALHLLVGPEGGWSAQERAQFLRLVQQKKLWQVHLGSESILRAETAALAALSIAVSFLAVTRPSSQVARE